MLRRTSSAFWIGSTTCARPAGRLEGPLPGAQGQEELAYASASATTAPWCCTATPAASPAWCSTTRGSPSRTSTRRATRPRPATASATPPSQHATEPPPTDETPEPEDAEPKAKARVIKKTRYELRTPSGELVAVHVRLDFDDGTKSMWYEDPAGNKTLNGKPKADLPLFGIHALGDAKIVIVCEGEKAAEALRELGVPAVGTATGADGCPCDDSLRPLLGLKVGAVARRDAPGRPHMDGMGAALRRLGQPRTTSSSSTGPTRRRRATPPISWSATGPRRP